MTNRNFTDPGEFGGPSGMMEDMARNPEKYGGMTPLPERGKGSETKLARQDSDINEIYRKLGFSMPIAKTAEMSGKYHGFLRDGAVDDPEEKAAILDALAIHRMVITSDCVQRKRRYDREEEEAKRWLSGIHAHRRPQSYNFDPYASLNSDADQEILLEYLKSIEEDEQALGDDDDGDGDDDGEEQAAILPRPRGRPRREAAAIQESSLPTVEELVNRWGAYDAFMFQVLLDEERHGIDFAEAHYDRYERAEARQRTTEFVAAMLPPAENAYFWCRVRQMGIVRERSYDIAMGFPIHDYSDVVDLIGSGKDIHDLAHLMDWSFDNAYRRVQGSMSDGQDHRMMVISMLAQQIPLSPQLMQMMNAPPPGYWQGYGGGQPEGQQPGEEQAPDRRGAIFSFFKNNPSGAQPQKQGGNKNRRRGRGNS